MIFPFDNRSKCIIFSFSLLALVIIIQSCGQSTPNFTSQRVALQRVQVHLQTQMGQYDKLLQTDLVPISEKLAYTQSKDSINLILIQTRDLLSKLETASNKRTQNHYTDLKKQIQFFLMTHSDSNTPNPESTESSLDTKPFILHSGLKWGYLIFLVFCMMYSFWKYGTSKSSYWIPFFMVWLSMLGFYSIYAFLNPSSIINLNTYQKHPTESAEVKRINQDAAKLKNLFFATLQQTETFKQTSYTRLNQFTQKQETIELKPSVFFDRIGNTDSVVAIYSYTIAPSTIITPSAPPQGTYEEEFIDYASGKYRLSDSHAALELMGVVKKSIDSILRPYLQQSNGIRIDLTGWADAQTIQHQHFYGGEYGDIGVSNEQFYYLEGQTRPIPIQLKLQDLIPTNEKLAFLRSMGVKDFLESQVGLKLFSSKHYNHFVVAHTTHSGGLFRKTQIRLAIQDPQLTKQTGNSSTPPPDPRCWECLACNLLGVWVQAGLLTVLLKLVQLEHKQIMKNVLRSTYIRNSCIILFVLVSILYTFC